MAAGAERDGEHVIRIVPVGRVRDRSPEAAVVQN